MLALTNTNFKIEALLGGNVSANNVEYTVTYRDTPTTGDEGEANMGTTNNASAATGSTAVTILGAPAQGIKREIENITVYNADTASATVTIRMNDGTNTWRLVKFVMATLYTLVYERGAGWVLYNASGVRS